jgi:hypothetical protein
MTSTTFTPTIKAKIDKVLSPLLEKIHRNKIYSYHQLKYGERNKLSSIFSCKNSQNYKPNTSRNYSCLDKINSDFIDPNIYPKTARLPPYL